MRQLKSRKYYLELAEEIKSLVDSINFGTSLVIVEGKNDETALRDFGLKTPVCKFRSAGHSETLFVDEIVGGYRGRSVVVMLDFDDEGTRMAEYISRELEEKGVKIQHYYRRALREILIKEGVRHLEELRAIRQKAELSRRQFHSFW